MRHVIAAAFLLVTVIQPAIETQKVSISGGFLKGKDYLDMDSAQKRTYAMGAINGMLVAPMFAAPSEKIAWLEKCTDSMTDEQVAAIITKYLTDHPGVWHYPLNMTSVNAMISACPDSKPKSPSASNTSYGGYFFGRGNKVSNARFALNT